MSRVSRRLKSGELYRATRLGNGIQAASVDLPGARTVALGWWTPFGSKDERRDQRGWAHVLEHMVFKKTEARSQEKISAFLDHSPKEPDGSPVQGAETDVDYTYAHVLLTPEMIDEGVEVLADVFGHPAFDDADLHTERQVVLREYSEEEESITGWSEELTLRKLFSGSRTAQLPIGRKQDIRAATAARLHTMRRRGYVTHGTRVIAVGAVRHDRFLRAVEQHFGALPRSYRKHPEAREPRPVVGTHRSLRPNAKHATLVRAWLMPPGDHPDHLPLELLARALGQGETSLIYHELRQLHGLIYHPSVRVWTYRDNPVLIVTLNTDHKKLGEVAERLDGLVGKLARRALSDNRFDRIRREADADLRYWYERPADVIERWKDDLILHGRYVSLVERQQALATVTPADLRRAARAWLRAETAVTVIAGRVDALATVRTPRPHRAVALARAA